MNDTYSIRLAKTELREGYNTGNVDRILSLFSDGLGDLSTGCASFWGAEAKAVLRHRFPREIADRTQEHLGRSDKGITAYRRLLRMAIDEAEKGGKPLMVLDAQTAAKITGPAAIDGIGPTDDWQGYWQKTDASKRKAASWANGH